MTTFTIVQSTTDEQGAEKLMNGLGLIEKYDYLVPKAHVSIINATALS